MLGGFEVRKVSAKPNKDVYQESEEDAMFTNKSKSFRGIELMKTRLELADTRTITQWTRVRNRD